MRDAPLAFHANPETTHERVPARARRGRQGIARRRDVGMELRYFVPVFRGVGRNVDNPRLRQQLLAMFM